MLTVSKPGETADVPVGVIAGSVIGGLLLLAAAVALLWKVILYFRYLIKVIKRSNNNVLKYLLAAIHVALINRNLYFLFKDDFSLTPDCFLDKLLVQI